MTAILNMIHCVEYSFEDLVHQFVNAHPYIASMLLLVGTPLFIVMAVVVCTTAIMVPFGLIFGWI